MTEQTQELEPLKPGEDCGGPLLCGNCAMKLAQKYFDHGILDWAELYRIHATILYNAEKIKELTEQNRMLMNEKAHKQNIL